MTAHPARRVADEPRFRVVRGRRTRKPIMAPWMIVVLVAVIGFLGLVFARTSLDGSAFELADLQRSIAQQHALNQELQLEIARLENPARIAPLAEELGMVMPRSTNQILVDLTPVGPTVASADAKEKTQ